MCLQGGGQRGLCVTSWRCQTPGIAVKHALAHVAICSVTRQHLGVPQTTEDEHGRQRRAVDPEAGTRAIDRPRSLLAGVWARRGVHLAYHVLQTAWRVFRQSCQQFGCRADAREGYATLVATRSPPADLEDLASHHHVSATTVQRHPRPPSNASAPFTTVPPHLINHPHATLLTRPTDCFLSTLTVHCPL